MNQFRVHGNEHLQPLAWFSGQESLRLHYSQSSLGCLCITPTRPISCIHAHVNCKYHLLTNKFVIICSIQHTQHPLHYSNTCRLLNIRTMIKLFNALIGTLVLFFVLLKLEHRSHNAKREGKNLVAQISLKPMRIIFVIMSSCVARCRNANNLMLNSTLVQLKMLSIICVVR